MPKVLIPIGDAAEAMDTLYPYFRVREDGYEAVVAAPERRIYPLVMHEIPPGWDITRESRQLSPGIGHRLLGGRSGRVLRSVSDRRTRPEYLRYDEDLIRIVRHFFERKAGGRGLPRRGDRGRGRCDRGRSMATVPKCRFDIELCGATFVNEGCVRYGNMVSGRTWHDQHLYMPEFMRMLAADCAKNAERKAAAVTD